MSLFRATSSTCPLDPFAFLASTMGELVPLRERLHSLAEASGRHLWVAEKCEPDLGGRPEFVAAACLQKIRRCRRFVAVLTDRYGSGSVDGISILELEVFQAMLARLPILIIALEPFNPDRRLESFLTAVASARPGVVRTSALDAIEPLVVKFLGLSTRFQSAELFTRAADGFGLFLQGLAGERSRLLAPSQSSDLRFLDGEVAPVSHELDPRAAERALDSANQQFGYAMRLAYLWMAFRHLSSAPYNNHSSKEFLPLWYRLLSDWASASTWYGVRGHLLIGRLAAVNTLLDIRQRAPHLIDTVPRKHQVHASRGAIASEYYSLAESVPSVLIRASFLRHARVEVEAAIREGAVDQSSLLSIRGAIHVACGDSEAAISDYKAALNLRCSLGESSSRIGEAMTTLGLAYVATGQRGEGERLAVEGVNLLELGVSEDVERAAFLVRAKGRLGWHYLRTGRVSSGVRALFEAGDLAERVQLALPSRGPRAMIGRLLRSGRLGHHSGGVGT